MKMTSVMLYLVLGAGLPAFSQDPVPPKQSDSKAGQVRLTGTVTHYDVAKSIEINVNGTSHKYDLNDSDTVYSIGPEVAEGIVVTVTETSDAQGHKTVSIGPKAP